MDIKQKQKKENDRLKMTEIMKKKVKVAGHTVLIWSNEGVT